MAALTGRHCTVVMFSCGLYVYHCMLVPRFSRRIMWARVSTSNNNPYIIAQYYLKCISMVGGMITYLVIDDEVVITIIINHNCERMSSSNAN